MPQQISIRHANLLYLVTMLLVITLGSLVQTVHLSLGLAATEILLIALPVFVLLRWKRAPWKETLRANPIPWGTALLSLLLGVALFPLSAILDGIMAMLSGIASVPLPDGALPKTALEGVLFFLALAVTAPLGEEILFRGLIQGAYERQLSGRLSILVASLMFAFYHFRLTGLPALLPVAFALGFVAWRTRSIYATMLVHFGMNASSAAFTLYTLRFGAEGQQIVTLWTAAAGALFSIALLLAIAHQHPAPQAAAEPPDAEAPAAPMPWFKVYWPLLAAFVLFAAVSGLTAAAQMLPDFGPASQPTFYKARVDHPITSRYQITSRSGEVVGDLTCRVVSHGLTWSVECKRTVRAYEANTPTGYFKDGDSAVTWKAAWDSETTGLVAFSFDRQSENGSLHGRLESGSLMVEGPNGQQTVSLPAGALLEYEWPWRSNNLTNDVGTRLKVRLAYLQRWDEQQETSLPVVKDEMLSLFPSSAFKLPFGERQVWTVKLGGQTAWYTRSDPGYPRPVQFDDGMLLYTLLAESR